MRVYWRGFLSKKKKKSLRPRSRKWQHFSTVPEETDNISADYFSVCNLLVSMHDEVPGARRLHKARLMTVNINHGHNSGRFFCTFTGCPAALSAYIILGAEKVKINSLLYN